MKKTKLAKLILVFAAVMIGYFLVHVIWLEPIVEQRIATVNERKAARAAERQSAEDLAEAQYNLEVASEFAAEARARAIAR